MTQVMSRRASDVVCWRCEREARKKDGSPVTRLPSGWHEQEGNVWCASCWKDSYVLRAITIPVAGPVEGSWEDLASQLHACWRDITIASNWAVTELRKIDITRTPEMDKLPPMPMAPDEIPPLTYLYRIGREVLPDLAPRSLTPTLQRVARNYSADRWDVVWTGRRSLRSYRYPQPYPVHNQAWRASYGPDEEPIISVELGTGDRRQLRLQRGHRFRRQLGAFRSLVKGDALRGELALIRRQRDGVTLAKMVMWLPRRPRARVERRGALVVQTANDSFLSYHVEDSDRIQHYHADHVRRLIAEYERRLQRLADDTKAERRRPRKNIRGIQAKRKIWVGKHRARLDSWTHEVSSVIAGYADRQGVALVKWDDRNRAYLPSAPYAIIRERLKYKLDELKIELEVIKGAPEDAEAAG